MIFEYIEYNDPLINKNNTEDLKFFGDNRFDQDTIEKITNRTPHVHTERLADVLLENMSKYGLSEAQKTNIEKLRNGQRVIIGGQQAGLLMSPSYILHKIITLLILQKDVKNKFNYDAVPVFWIAGEDHDYDEVNHTHVYDRYHNRIKKISYKPNLSVPMSIGFYDFDKKAMREVVDELFNYLKDDDDLKTVKETIEEKLHDFDSWTDFFTAIVHELFKDTGLLIVNAHSAEIRAIEKDMFKTLFIRHEEIDDAFRKGQEKFTKHFNTKKTIDTETNVHLFINSTKSRSLLAYEEGLYHAGEETFVKDNLLEMLDKDTIEFSNNVVTRPLMQEYLFNTLIFVGGAAEVKYWGELNEVFKVLDMDMPLILKRMEFTYIDTRLQKLMQKYNLVFSKNLQSDIERVEETLITENENKRLIKALDKQKYKVMNQYDALIHCCKEGFERQLIESNYKAQMKQIEYLKRRYHLEVTRRLRRELNDLKEIENLLLPNGVLQERVYHPLTFSKNLWDYSPLIYDEQHVIIKE